MAKQDTTQLVGIREYSQDGRLGFEGGFGLIGVRVYDKPRASNNHCPGCGSEVWEGDRLFDGERICDACHS